MRKYVIQTGKMDEMLGMLSRVLNLRITFFDLQESELRGFNIKGMSAFCGQRRSSDAAFDARCVKCDQEHLLAAKQAHDVHVYHCHAGLLEGIVPLYDHHRVYLGSIVFGQLRDRGRPPCPDTAALGESSAEEMRDIGALLKCNSEYIIENELIRYCGKPWAERLEDYVRDNLGAKLTLAMLAEEVGKSKSFLSHNFPVEFGVSLKQYLERLRMDKAKAMLQEGGAVREVAAALGFYDEFHFSKGFKRHFGAPPITFKSR